MLGINNIKWVHGEIPEHPFFEKESQITQIVSSIKNELYHYFLKGIEIIINTEKPSDKLLQLWHKEKRLWLLTLILQRYGVIYFISRSEAIYSNKKFHHFSSEINEIADYLLKNSKVNRIINYGVHCFITSPKRVVNFSNELVPPNAISAIGDNHVCVRRNDFFSKKSYELLATSKALYDLHDFTHLATATLSKDLYGNKYFDTLIYLPKALKKLISSPKLNTTDAVPHSDGLIFSQFLTHLFNNLDYTNMDNKQCVISMATSLVAYYMNEAPLFHPSSGEYLKANSAILIDQLATLVQNKSYELPASEIEQKMFTRGGIGPQDILFPMKSSKRIKYISNIRKKWLYFEKRNTLKHRAHKLAYRNLAVKFLNDPKISTGKEQILSLIIENIDYIDFKRGDRKDLWQHLLQ